MEKRITTGRALISFGTVLGALGAILIMFAAGSGVDAGAASWLFLILGIAGVVIGYLQRLISVAESR